MQKLLFPCLVLFLALSFVDARPPTQKDDTWYQKGKSVILKSSNFDAYIRQEPNVIVEFITSFSTDSQKMSDEWNKLAEMYMGENPKRNDVKVAIIDGWTFSTVSHDYGVKVFPQILFFTGGNKDAKARYEGEKTAVRISEWLEAEIASANAGAAQTDTLQPVDDTVATSDASADAPTSTDTASSTDSTTQQNQANQAPPDEKPVQTPPPAEQQQQQQQQQQPPQQQQQQPPEQQQQQQPPKPQTPPPQQQQQQQQQPPQQNQQQQQPPKPQTPPPQQQKQENNAPAGQEEAKKEVKVVLNTTLLQTQFEALQKHMDAVTVNLKENINDNVKKIEELKSLLDVQKQEMANLHISLRGQTQKFDEIKQLLINNRQEVQQTVTGHTEKHLDEVKGALNQIKGKVFEQKPAESKGFGSGLLYLVIGGLVGGAITFLCLNLGSNNKKRKLLID